MICSVQLLLDLGGTLAGKVSLYFGLLVVWFTTVIAFRSRKCLINQPLLRLRCLFREKTSTSSPSVQPVKTCLFLWYLSWQESTHFLHIFKPLSFSVGTQLGLVSSKRDAGLPKINCCNQIPPFSVILSVRSAQEIAA